MEPIGDSPLINANRDKSEVQKKETELGIFKFEFVMDDFDRTLTEEEARLIHLEKKRVEIVEELNELSLEINEEKKKYRKAIDSVISEYENMQYFTSDCSNDLTPTQSSTELLETCAETIESSENLDYNIEINIEEVRCDLMKSFEKTKEDYLSTMKELFQLEKNLEMEADTSKDRLI